MAAGLVGAALGSDGAGSIRIPAAWCGLFGLKPQRGRVSMAPHARGWHGLSVKGVLTRRVADTALFHDVASGAIEIDARPRARARRAVLHVRRHAAADRCGSPTPRASRPGVIAKLDADARRAFEETVELLRSLGHQLSERDPDYGAGAIPALTVRYLRGIHDGAAALAHPERLERRTRAMARTGRADPAGAARALARRRGTSSRAG